MPLLGRVAAARWIDGALRIGRSAGAAVHWSVDLDRLTLLIGHDDQTWDVGLTLPASLLPTIIEAVNRCLAGGTTTAPGIPPSGTEDRRAP